MIYILLLTVLLFGSIYFNNTNRKETSNVFYCFECLLIICIMGFRYKVGGDSINYYYSFQSSPSISELWDYDYSTSKYNIGWLMLTAIAKLIHDDFVTLQLIQALIVNIAVFTFFKKYVRKKYIAVLLYVLMYMFTFNTEIMRAAISVSVFLYGFGYYLNHRWVKYYILCCIALAFHSEAIVMFIFPICHKLSSIRINIKKLIFFYLFCICSVSIVNFIPQLTSILSFSTQMSMILKLYSHETIDSNLFGYISHSLSLMPWFYFLWLSKDDKKLYWRGFIILFIFFSFQQLRYMVFMNRACDMLYIFTIVAIVDSLTRVKYHQKNRKLLLMISVFIVVGLRINSFIANQHWMLFYPYSSVFAPKENIKREILLLKFQGVN